MTIFLLHPKTTDVNIEGAVKSAFKDECLKLDSGSWLVSANGTQQEVVEKIGVTEQGGPSVIAFATSGYWGRAPAPVSDWLKAKLETKAND
jgi:hypothetical protein